jgi:hypothetical protein
MNRGKTKNQLGLIIIGLVLLVLGLVLYLVYSPNTFISKQVYSLFHLRPARIKLTPFTLAIRWWIPDFLWMSSFTMFTQAVFNFEKPKCLWLMLCSLLGVILEILQWTNAISGTADILDIIVYGLASLFAIGIILILKEDKNHE